MAFWYVSFIRVDEIFLPYSIRKPLSLRLNYFYPVFPNMDNFLRGDLMFAAGGAENSVLEVFI